MIIEEKRRCYNQKGCVKSGAPRHGRFGYAHQPWRSGYPRALSLSCSFHFRFRSIPTLPSFASERLTAVLLSLAQGKIENNFRFEFLKIVFVLLINAIDNTHLYFYIVDRNMYQISLKENILKSLLQLHALINNVPDCNH